jgi:predicted nucleic acid-binding protein
MLDTSVVIDLDVIPADALPAEACIATLTLAELAAGPIAAQNLVMRAKRLERLQVAESTLEAIPFDAAAARAYARVYAASLAASQKPRGNRAIDLLIAATALSRGLTLYTRNPADFESVAGLLNVVPV